MSDKRIQDLTPAESIQLADRFVLEQAGQAKSLTGQILLDDLATALDGHGGISNITYTEPVAPSLNGTLTITMADGETYDVTITNGNGIDSIAVAYGIASTANPAYVPEWYSVVVAPTDTFPYAFTRLTITDSTGGTTVAYTITQKADDPTISVGTVTADEGETADATVTNVGTAYNPVLNFDFTLPQGEKGDTGDYIIPVVSYGTSTAAATEPTTWYSSPTSISYSAGNYIWKRTQYTLHDAQTVQDTKTEIIGYIGQNGSGSGTVNQITFNGSVFHDDGTGNVTMNISPGDVDAIADPTTKSNGQVLTYDSTANAWVAANPATGNVNTVNAKGVDAGTTNITLYASDIKMSSSDNTTIPNAIPQASSSTPANLGTASSGSGTTWARADHVHAMPSAADVGAASSDDVKYKIYNSITDLGLTEGSATMAGVLAAMPNRSILITAVDGVFASGQTPGSYGTVEIVKTSGNRGSCIFHNSVNSGDDYRISINSNTDWTTWSRIQHGNFADKLKYINPTFTVGTINAGNNSGGKQFTLTADSGYTILGVVGYQITGNQWGYVHPTQLLCNRGTGSQTLYVTLVNTGSSQATNIKIKVVVLEALTN